MAENIFTYAADMIEKRGWCQEPLGYNLDSGACCAGVALDIARRDLGAPNATEAPLYPFIGADGPAGVIRWNDKPGQTKENVVATLRKVGEQVHG